MRTITNQGIELSARKAIRGKGNLILNLPQLWVKNTGIVSGSDISCYIDVRGNLVLRKSTEGKND